jgi:uncharacterized protein YxjI
LAAAVVGGVAAAAAGGIGKPGEPTPASPAAAAPAAGAAPAGNVSPTARRFMMRQKTFAFGDDYTVRDESGQPAYLIDGKALRIRDSLYFNDLQGNNIYFIQEKLARLRDSMSIYRGQDVVARVHNALVTPLRNRFSIDMTGQAPLTAMGKFIWAEYTISRGGSTAIATITKRWNWLARDTYGIEVAPNEDAPLMLAIAVCIDMMTFEGR